MLSQQQYQTGNAYVQSKEKIMSLGQPFFPILGRGYTCLSNSKPNFLPLSCHLFHFEALK